MSLASEYTKRLHPVVLARSGIPMIKVSSGSIGNNGALTAITALPLTYASCYLYLPAAAISAGSTAGWYYAVMSSTTAGTIYNNTYTTGVPSVPSSPTAFATTGPGAFTGDTTEQGASITLPGNALGANGGFEVWHTYSMTSSANNKTCRVRWDGSSGTQFAQPVLTTSVSENYITRVYNRGATNKQVVFATAAGTPVGASNGSPVTGAIDSTADTTIFISVHNANAADNHILEGWEITVRYFP